MTPAFIEHITTLRALRAAIRSDGWHHRAGRDICPLCWDEGHR